MPPNTHPLWANAAQPDDAFERDIAKNHVMDGYKTTWDINMHEAKLAEEKLRARLKPGKRLPKAQAVIDEVDRRYKYAVEQNAVIDEMFKLTDEIAQTIKNDKEYIQARQKKIIQHISLFYPTLKEILVQIDTRISGELKSGTLRESEAALKIADLERKLGKEVGAEEICGKVKEFLDNSTGQKHAEAVNTELAELKSNVEQLKSNLESLKESLEKKKTESADLRGKKQLLEADVTSLRSSVKVGETHLRDLKLSMDEIRQKNAEYMSYVSELKSKITELENVEDSAVVRLEEANLKNSSLQKDLNKERQLKSKAQEDLQHVIQAKELEANHVQSLKESNAQLQSEVKKASGRSAEDTKTHDLLFDSHLKCQELEIKVKGLSSNVMSMKRDSDLKAGTISTLQEDLIQLRRERDTLDVKQANFESRRRQFEDEAQSLRGQIGQQQTEIGKLTGGYEELNRDKKEVEKRLSDATERSRNLETELAKEQEMTAKLQAAVQNGTRALEESSKASKDAQEKSSKDAEQLRELIDTLGSQLTIIKTEKDGLERAKKDLESRETKLSASLDVWRRASDGANKDNARVEGANVYMEGRINALELREASFERERADWEEERLSLTKDTETLRGDKRIARVKAANKVEELQRLRAQVLEAQKSEKMLMADKAVLRRDTMTVNNLFEDIEEKEEALSQAEAKLEDYRKTLSTQASQYEDRAKELTDWEDRLTANQTNLDTTVALVDERNTRLRTGEQALTTREQDLSNAKSAFELEGLGLRSDLQDANNMIGLLRPQIEKLTTQVTTLEKENRLLAAAKGHEAGNLRSKSPSNSQVAIGYTSQSRFSIPSFDGPPYKSPYSLSGGGPQSSYSVAQLSSSSGTMAERPYRSPYSFSGGGLQSRYSAAQSSNSSGTMAAEMIPSVYDSSKVQEVATSHLIQPSLTPSISSVTRSPSHNQTLTLPQVQASSLFEQSLNLPASFSNSGAPYRHSDSHSIYAIAAAPSLSIAQNVPSARQYSFLVSGTPAAGLRIDIVAPGLIDKMQSQIDKWNGKAPGKWWVSRLTVDRCVENRLYHLSTRDDVAPRPADPNHSFSCPRCVKHRLLCVMVSKGYSAVVVPLPVEERSLGATIQDVGKIEDLIQAEKRAVRDRLAAEQRVDETAAKIDKHWDDLLEEIRGDYGGYLTRLVNQGHRGL